VFDEPLFREPLQHAGDRSSGNAELVGDIGRACGPAVSRKLVDGLEIVFDSGARHAAKWSNRMDYCKRGFASHALRYLPRMQTTNTKQIEYAATADPRFRNEVRALAVLALPIIVSQLGMIGMTTADTVMVGRLGAVPLAAAGLGSAIHTFTLVI
jgi:hypothetical protein